MLEIACPHHINAKLRLINAARKRPSRRRCTVFTLGVGGGSSGGSNGNSPTLSENGKLSLPSIPPAGKFSYLGYRSYKSMSHCSYSITQLLKIIRDNGPGRLPHRDIMRHNIKLGEQL